MSRRFQEAETVDPRAKTASYRVSSDTDPGRLAGALAARHQDQFGVIEMVAIGVQAVYQATKAAMMATNMVHRNGRIVMFALGYRKVRIDHDQYTATVFRMADVGAVPAPPRADA